jgi:hypothetical protein
MASGAAEDDTKITSSRALRDMFCRLGRLAIVSIRARSCLAGLWRRQWRQARRFSGKRGDR